MKFKVGDVVVCRDAAGPEARLHLALHATYVVSEIMYDDDYIRVEGIPSNQWGACRFRHVTNSIASKDDQETEIKNLVDTANLGRKALARLLKLCPNRIEVRGHDLDEWKLQKTCVTNLEYRVKPKYTIVYALISMEPS